ncbi:MAG: hypothetical protein KAR03_03325 [Candidatus Thorarchaeota archaeon]|nr:hypothetical protein [Candidatus Thorarchaeota archaeon]
MTDRDSLSYIKLVRICKKHLQWVGLSEAARDILAVLLTENYWSGDPISPEVLSSITGYSRGSISVAISQLRSLGFIESRVDMKQEGRGRRPTLYTLSEGLSGLIMFGIRRLNIELEGMLTEIMTMKAMIDSQDEVAVNALTAMEREANSNADRLREFTRRILSAKAVLDADQSLIRE